MSDAAFQDARLKGDFKSKGPELLVDLAEQCSVALRETAGLDKDKAEQVGREIADRMASHWGGQNIYFPMASRTSYPSAIARFTTTSPGRTIASWRGSTASPSSGFTRS